jgi:hypothetical protein
MQAPSRIQSPNLKRAGASRKYFSAFQYVNCSISIACIYLRNVSLVYFISVKAVS